MPKGCAEREGQVKGLLYGPTETTVTGAVNRHDLISLPSYRPACLYRLTLTAGLSHETGLVPSTHPPLPPLQIPTPIRWSVVSPPAPRHPPFCYSFTLRPFLPSFVFAFRTLFSVFKALRFDILQTFTFQPVLAWCVSRVTTCMICLAL